MTQLERAITLAVDAHEGQIDKSGQPYILHPLRVMLSLIPHGETVMIIGVLHDVVEDTPVTLDEIRVQFGDEIADGVDSVTKRPRDVETYRQFVERSAKHPLGRKVKRADVNDNALPVRQTHATQGMEKRYNMALAILDAAEVF